MYHLSDNWMESEKMIRKNTSINAAECYNRNNHEYDFWSDTMRTCQFITAIICFFTISILSQYSDAANVTVTWNPSPSVDVRGYIVHVGYEPGKFSYSVDVGNTTSATLDSLPDGTILYFAATAYNSFGQESDYSEHVVYSTPKNFDCVSTQDQTRSVHSIFLPTPVVLNPVSESTLSDPSPVELGVASVNDSGVDIFFTARFQEPVMVTFPMSPWKGEPFWVQIESLQQDKARLRLVNGDELDAWHGLENVAYLAIEAGHHHFEGGLRLEAAKVGVPARLPFTYVPFSGSFEEVPIVLAQYCDYGPVTALSPLQVINVTTGGFLVYFEDWRKAFSTKSRASDSSICYVAVEPGEGNIDAAAFEAGHLLLDPDGAADGVPNSENLHFINAFFAMPQSFIDHSRPVLMGEWSAGNPGLLSIHLEVAGSPQDDPTDKSARIGYFALGSR